MIKETWGGLVPARAQDSPDLGVWFRQTLLAVKQCTDPFHLLFQPVLAAGQPATLHFVVSFGVFEVANEMIHDLAGAFACQAMVPERVHKSPGQLVVLGARH
jgi:hypothetical protein